MVPGRLYKNGRQLFRVFVRLLNVSIYQEVQHQIFQNECHITTDITENTLKTLDFLLNVVEMKFKSRKINQKSPEAIQVQLAMSHMYVELTWWDVEGGVKGGCFF